MSETPNEPTHGEYDAEFPVESLEPDYEAEQRDETEDEVLPIPAEDLADAAGVDE